MTGVQTCALPISLSCPARPCPVRLFYFFFSSSKSIPKTMHKRLPKWSKNPPQIDQKVSQNVVPKRIPKKFEKIDSTSKVIFFGSPERQNVLQITIRNAMSPKTSFSLGSPSWTPQVTKMISKMTQKPLMKVLIKSLTKKLRTYPCSCLERPRKRPL